jgi:hypothetical protein
MNAAVIVLFLENTFSFHTQNVKSDYVSEWLISKGGLGDCVFSLSEIKPKNMASKSKGFTVSGLICICQQTIGSSLLQLKKDMTTKNTPEKYLNYFQNLGPSTQVFSDF